MTSAWGKAKIDTPQSRIAATSGGGPILPRDDALPFPHICRVQASAGSGKTYLLACRFVQYILSDRIPRSRLQDLLAITFTNEATAEMRRRILSLLKRLTFGDPEVLKSVSPLFSMKQDRLQERAARQVDELLSHFDDWQVRTIDSFVHRLIQSAPAELGLSPRQEIVSHEAEYFAAALDRILWRLPQAADLRTRLREFVVHYMHAQERAAWWPHSALLSMLQEFHGIEASHGLSFKVRPETGFFGLAKELALSSQTFLREAEDQGVALKQHAHAAIEAAGDKQLPRALGRKAWGEPELVALCRKGTKVPEALARNWGALRHLAGQYAMALAEVTARPYLRLLVPWRHELSELKAKGQVIFLSDLNRLARRLLDEVVLPEVVFRLGESLHHYLLDEFQDTSALQWANLFPLIDNALAQGGSVFCVGDKKQLLYRWRGSDLAVFTHGLESFRSVEPASRLELVLPYSWRSREVILETVSRIFSEENIRAWIRSECGLPDEAIFLNVFSKIQQAIPGDRLGGGSQGGLVEIRLLPDGNRAATEEACHAELMPLLKDEILPRRSPREILILVRDNREVLEITGWLTASGVPVISHRQMDVRHDSVVRELLQILRFLDRPTDDRALAAILAGWLMADLWAELASNRERPDIWAWLEACRGATGETTGRGGDPARRRYLYQQLQDAHAALWDSVFEELVQAVGFMPPYDLLVRVIRRLDVESRFPAHEAAVQHLLELIHIHEANGGQDLEAFLQWVEDGPEDVFMANAPGDVDAVRVMTVHKAKGLEAEVVILPLASVAVRGSSRIYRADSDGLSIFHLNTELRQVSPELDRWYKEEQEQQWVDELNVLYVALTRARDEMYVFVPSKAGQARNRLVGLLAPILGGERAKTLGLRPTQEVVERPASKPSLHRSSSLDIVGSHSKDHGQEAVQETEPAAGRGNGLGGTGCRWPALLVRRGPDLEKAISPHRRRALWQGEAVHRLLALLPTRLPADPQPEAVREYLERLFAGSQDLIAREALLDCALLAHTLCDPLARPLFWPEEGASARVEKEIADAAGELYRLDRLILGQSDLWVGEYKTGAGPRHGDFNQLRHYLRLLPSIYPERKPTGLLLYVEEGRVITVEM